MGGGRSHDLQPHTGLPASGTPSLKFAATHDVDEQAALLSGWNQAYDQLSPGVFDGRLMDLTFGPVRLFREVTSSALQQSGGLPPDVISVGVPMSLSGPATFCGQACDGQQLHVFSGNDQFEFFSPSGLDIVGFVVRKADLLSDTSAASGYDAAGDPVAPHLKAIDCHSTNALRQLFAEVCQVISQDAECVARADVQRAMLDDVHAAILSVLVPCAGDLRFRDAGLSPARRAAIVNNVHNLVVSQPDRYQNVQAVCSTLGLSRRTLQHAFHKTLGIKPSAYLRAVRLNGARRSIKQDASVTEAATAWGFWHFGRFAHDYRMMFGELPSEQAAVSRRLRNCEG